MVVARGEQHGAHHVALGPGVARGDGRGARPLARVPQVVGVVLGSDGDRRAAALGRQGQRVERDEQRRPSSRRRRSAPPRCRRRRRRSRRCRRRRRPRWRWRPSAGSVSGGNLGRGGRRRLEAHCDLGERSEQHRRAVDADAEDGDRADDDADDPAGGGHGISVTRRGAQAQPRSCSRSSSIP